MAVIRLTSSTEGYHSFQSAALHPPDNATSPDGQALPSSGSIKLKPYADGYIAQYANLVTQNRQRFPRPGRLMEVYSPGISGQKRTTIVEKHQAKVRLTNTDGKLISDFRLKEQSAEFIDSQGTVTPLPQDGFLYTEGTIAEGSTGFTSPTKTIFTYQPAEESQGASIQAVATLPEDFDRIVEVVSVNTLPDTINSSLQLYANSNRFIRNQWLDLNSQLWTSSHHTCEQSLLSQIKTPHRVERLKLDLGNTETSPTFNLLRIRQVSLFPHEYEDEIHTASLASNLGAPRLGSYNLAVARTYLSRDNNYYLYGRVLGMDPTDGIHHVLFNAGPISSTKDALGIAKPAQLMQELLDDRDGDDESSLLQRLNPNFRILTRYTTKARIVDGKLTVESSGHIGPDGPTYDYNTDTNPIPESGTVSLPLQPNGRLNFGNVSITTPTNGDEAIDFRVSHNNPNSRGLLQFRAGPDQQLTARLINVEPLLSRDQSRTNILRYDVTTLTPTGIFYSVRTPDDFSDQRAQAGIKPNGYYNQVHITASDK